MSTDEAFLTMKPTPLFRRPLLGDDDADENEEKRTLDNADAAVVTMVRCGTYIYDDYKKVLNNSRAH